MQLTNIQVAKILFSTFEMTELKSTGKSERFWNNVSKRFGNSNRSMSSPALQFIKQNADNYFKPTDRILDIGCGPGDITLELARKTKEVFATDISEGMIEAATQKADERNYKNIQFIRTDLSDNSFQPYSFDVITAFNMLQYVPDKKILIGKIFELLKPQGLFLSSTACLRERKSFLRFTLAGLTTLNIVPEIGKYTTPELEKEIEESGFTIIEASDISKVPERLIIAKKG